MLDPNAFEKLFKFAADIIGTIVSNNYLRDPKLSKQSSHDHNDCSRQG